MAKITFVVAEPKHVKPIVQDLRCSDLEEARACGIEDKIEEVFLSEISPSSNTWVMLVGDTPVAIGGIKDDLHHGAVVWVQGTNGCTKYIKSLTRQCISVTRQFLNQYAVLWNVVPKHHTVTHRWLEKVGFTIDHSREFMGVDGTAMIGFSMRNDNV